MPSYVPSWFYNMLCRFLLFFSIKGDFSYFHDSHRKSFNCLTHNTWAYSHMLKLELCIYCEFCILLWIMYFIVINSLFRNLKIRWVFLEVSALSYVHFLPLQNISVSCMSKPCQLHTPGGCAHVVIWEIWNRLVHVQWHTRMIINYVPFSN